MVRLSDPAYVDEIRTLFACTRERFEADTETSERRGLPVWTVSDRTMRNCLIRAVDDAARGGFRLISEVSPHTFSHSFAMHMLYNHIHPKVLQALHGHEKSESTKELRKVFTLDVATGLQVRFSLDTGAALPSGCRNMAPVCGADFINFALDGAICKFGIALQ